MIKMAALKDAIGDGLAHAGFPGSEAGLTAQAGVAVFQTAFERWAHAEGSVEFRVPDLRSTRRTARGDQPRGPPRPTTITGTSRARTR